MLINLKDLRKKCLSYHWPIRKYVPVRCKKAALVLCVFPADGEQPDGRSTTSRETERPAMPTTSPILSEEGTSESMPPSEIVGDDESFLKSSASPPPDGVSSADQPTTKTKGIKLEDEDVPTATHPVSGAATGKYTVPHTPVLKTRVWGLVPGYLRLIIVPWSHCSIGFHQATCTIS